MANIINIGYGGLTILYRSDAYNAYTNSIRGFDLIPQEEEEKLLKEYISSDDKERKIEIRNKLLEANQRFIMAAAKQYANSDVNLFLDMVNEANMAFIEAIECYDFKKTKKGARLCSWAAYYIRRACNFYLINHGQLVRQSNNHLTYHKLASARNRLSQKLEREATDEEVMEYLAKECKAPIKDVRDVRKMTVSSVDMNYDDEDNFNPSIVDFNNATSNLNVCEKNTEQSYVSTLVKSALSVLSERDQKIIRMLYGLNEDGIEYCADTVAERFGFTAERIRQIHNAALKKMSSKVKRVKAKV